MRLRGEGLDPVGGMGSSTRVGYNGWGGTKVFTQILQDVDLALEKDKL